MTRAIDNYLDRERPVATTENDVSNDYAEYAALPGINWSRLKLLDDQAGGCPADLRDAIDDPIDTSTHSRRGLRLDHTMTLEPHNFERDYFIGQAHHAAIDAVEKRLNGDSPHNALSCFVAALLDKPHPRVVVYDGTRRGKAWTEFKDANAGAIIAKPAEKADAMADSVAVAHDIACANAGRTRITQKQYDDAKAKADAVRSHPVAGPIVTNPDSEFEGVVEYIDPETGLPCKGRADIQVHVGRMTWDFKSMRSVSPREMEREIGRMRYHGQGGHYTKHNGYGFGIIGVAKCANSGGYRVTVMELGETWMAAGMALRDRLMARYAECEQTNHWPDHCDGAVLVADNPPTYILSSAFGDDEGVTVTYDED